MPHTHADIDAMLKTIGVDSIEALFSDVPKSLTHHDLDIPSSLSELELLSHMEELSSMNTPLKAFIGAGAYDHYTPTVIRHLIERQEFLTAYTPYQPEISQGTLQYIFEFQSMMTQLTGMDVSNASMYDGATATAEAMFMACAVRRKNHVLISETVNPNVVEVVKTYAKYKGITVTMVAEKDGETDYKDMESKLSNDVASLIVQNPNVYGIVENYTGVKTRLNETKTMFVINQDPSTLSHLKTPASWGADIAVGDAQTLGVPLSYGGPYIGYMTTMNAFIRKMPGRICGVTKDSEGKRAFVLTLQAREQHIRREKANSNICSNQSLLALFVTIYLSIMGKKGLYEAQQQSFDAAHYMYEELLKLSHFEKAFDKPFFKEFTLTAKTDIHILQNALKAKGYLGPLALNRFDQKYDQRVTFAVTEKRTKKEIDEVIQILGAL